MQKTPLYEEHVALGAKMVPFSAWLLPLQFAGIRSEHLHTRSRVSLFDCSHMAEFLVQGSGSMQALDPLLFNRVSSLPVGRCRYSGLQNARGGIIDDLVAMRLNPDELYVVTNAGPRERVAPILCRACNANDQTLATAKIDVQGPLSREVLLRLGLDDAARLEYFGVCRTEWDGSPMIVSRAGYTGELGYELYVPNSRAVALWQELLKQPEAAPAGLGARDTLRLEMGYGLYGQDADDAHTALESGMSRFIDWDHEFHARALLVEQRETGQYKVRTGVRSLDRRAPRAGQEVLHDGCVVGVVTSGTFGPSVNAGIGLAYLPVPLSRPGVRLTVGPKEIAVETARLPFYTNGSLKN